MNGELVTVDTPDKYVKTEPISDEQENGDSPDLLDLEQCDASTIVNVSLLNKEKKNVTKRSNETENEIGLLGSSSSKTLRLEIQAEPSQKGNDKSEDRVAKVVGWLEHSLYEPQEELESLKATEKFLTENWLEKNESNALFEKNIRRVRVFLLDVEPSLDNEPLDLVSGYCYEACKNFSVYSTIVWSQEDRYETPLCPICVKSDVEKELRLTFRFKLLVMDRNGHHEVLNVWHNQAEEFLGCSTKDYVEKSVIREAVVTPLRQNTVANTIHEDFTPLLDANVVCIKGSYFLVNTYSAI